jgi:serine/threonine protein phosphatase PrpC
MSCVECGQKCGKKEEGANPKTFCNNKCQTGFYMRGGGYSYKTTSPQLEAADHLPTENKAAALGRLSGGGHRHIGNFADKGSNTRGKKEESFNEDNFFITQNWLGIFDGVGGSAVAGKNNVVEFVDHLKTACLEYRRLSFFLCYSKEPLWGLLKKQKNRYIERTAGARPSTVKQMFEEMLKNMTISKAYGSSTVTILQLDSATNHLSSLQYGDSGWFVLRPRDKFSVVCNHLNEPKAQLSWNQPAQVSKRKNMPLSPIDYTHLRFDIQAVQPGDLIVLCTDGVSDNLFFEELRTLVWIHYLEYTAENDTTAGLAEYISKHITDAIVTRFDNEAAYRSSFAATPFIQGFLQAFDSETIPYNKLGITKANFVERMQRDLKTPKVDDITILVAIVE